MLGLRVCQPATHQLAQQNAEAIHVGFGRRCARHHHLGRHVRRIAHDSGLHATRGAYRERKVRQLGVRHITRQLPSTRGASAVTRLVGTVARRHWHAWHIPARLQHECHGVESAALVSARTLCALSRTLVQCSILDAAARR